MKTPLSSILLVLFASFIGSFGAVFLKAGAGRLHREIRTLLLNWRLAAGILMYLASFVFYYLGVREGELSVLYPMVSLGYIWTLLWSRLFFGEPISRRKVAGLALIIGGIVVLNLGNR
ncbi:MAG: EamA family transporter [Bryobacteraceae bacterium]|nr:EamA family transporter [Bryobacteraceae bacterium]